MEKKNLYIFNSPVDLERDISRLPSLNYVFLVVYIYYSQLCDFSRI